jgi:hypothetical protein
MENINNTIKEYYEALDRLIKNTPINIEKGFKINKDSVAIEAGRKRGSIKKSREVFHDLIEAIDDAANKKLAPQKELDSKLSKLKSQRDNYKELYEKALNREVMYLERINELEKMINKKNPLAINDENYGQR